MGQYVIFLLVTIVYMFMTFPRMTADRVIPHLVITHILYVLFTKFIFGGGV